MLSLAASTVGLLWEATRHILLWYFSTLSVVGVVYGSLATTIVGLLSLEVASIILLLGAQVIAEYERLQDGDTATPGELKTEVTALTSELQKNGSIAPFQPKSQAGDARPTSGSLRGVLQAAPRYAHSKN